MKQVFFQAIGMMNGKNGPGSVGRCCDGAGSCHCCLDAISPGNTCTIRCLRGCGPVRQRLLDLGFQPGREIRVVRNAPLRDPIELQLGDTFIVLRRREAAQIEVQHG